MNAFVFKIALPVLVFKDLYQEDFIRYGIRNTYFLLFSDHCRKYRYCNRRLLFPERQVRAGVNSFKYRSSAAILGITLVENIYGNAGMTPFDDYRFRSSLQHPGGYCSSCFQAGTGTPGQEALFSKQERASSRTPLFWEF